MQAMTGLSRQMQMQYSFQRNWLRAFASCQFFLLGFLINCEGVKYDFFGNLEVSSKTAFSILLANIDKCQYDTYKNWKVASEEKFSTD